MRAIVVALALLCVFLTCSNAKGEEWVYYASDSQGSDFFYDRESISFPSTNIIRVRKKRVFTEEARKQIMVDRAEAQLPTEGFDELSYSLILEETNCKTRKSNIRVISYCGKTGNIISRVTVPGIVGSWETLRPGSIGDMLRKAVCKVRNDDK
jgi:hypothetical protein